MIPDVYADAFKFNINPYGVSFTFGIQAPDPAAEKAAIPEERAILRMSLEQSKVLAMMLRKNLKQYEQEQHLEIPLPQSLYTKLGLSLQDW